MKNRFFPLWIIWSLVGAVLFYFAAADGARYSPLSVTAITISAAPLFGLMLTLGSPKAFLFFTGWLNTSARSVYWITGGLVFLFSLPGLLTDSFDPYSAAVFGIIVFTIFAVAKQQRNTLFDWNDLALWLLLWIPFDLRWSMELHTLLGYTWWAIAIPVIALIAWKGFRDTEIGYNLIPRRKDLAVTSIILLLIMVILIPPGLLTGFLSFSWPEHYDIPKLAVYFAGIFFTIALPEELFFRGVLLNGLKKMSSKKWVPLLVSSIAFGLMHWNNISGTDMQITYVILATLAGAGYGWAYIKSGNNLFAAVLTHTLVDWIWKLYLA